MDNKSDRTAERLLEILELTPIETNLFRGANEHGTARRLFGGQVLSQALRAACCTVDATVDALDGARPRIPHSLHGYFLRPGDRARPVLYDVERIRDGKSFTTRRIVAIQNGEAIFNASVSFHNQETGFEHAHPMPNVPEPETLSSDTMFADDQSREGFGAHERPFELRTVYQDTDARTTHRLRNPIWVRFKAPTDPADAFLRYCLLAYASDMGLVSTGALPHSSTVARDELQLASLDHALWIHREFDVGRWLLFNKRTTVGAGSRAMNHAEFFDGGGRLVASVSQEGLLRRAGAPATTVGS